MSDSISISGISESYYPSIIALCETHIDCRYAFVLRRLVQAMAAVAGSTGSIEIYAIDTAPLTNLPQLNLISSPDIDDDHLERIFDELTPLLQRIAAGHALS